MVAIFLIYKNVIAYLIIGNGNDKLVIITVKMKVNINQMRQEPLGIPTILLGILHFQIP